MTDLQKLAIRASELRSKLNTLAGAEELSDEQRVEVDTLTAEYTDVEARVRAATVAADDDTTVAIVEDAEGRELRELIAGSDLGGIFAAAIEHRSTSGQTSELQQHYGLTPNQVPLALLESRAVTPAPTDTGASQAAIIPGVFPDACAAFLGVDMPTVPVGDAVFPVLTTNATVGRKGTASSDAIAETTGSFSVEVLSPERLQASFFYRRTDAARFATMGESLRQNLNEALADGLDKEIIAGTNGLLTSTNLPNHNVSAVTTYALYRSQLAYSRVDGKYASTAKDLRILFGSDTLAHAAAQYRGSNDNQDALMSLLNATSGVKVSAHVPDAASNKQNSVVRLGMRRDAVAAIWDGVTLIADEVTKAKSGEIVVTAVMLHAVKILRADGFYKQQTQHA